MRFEYYHAGLDGVPKLSVDGTVDNAIHFSHWEGNSTPASVKADTSTEIALNLVGSANALELTQGIELVTNNHFDTDGVLSVWTVLNGARASDLRERLIAAAEAGDFSEYSSVDGVRASLVIQGSDDPADASGSPLARQLAGGEMPDDATAYRLVLPHVERVLTHTDEYESLWTDGWRRIALAMESFERKTSSVEEFGDGKLSLIILAPELYSAKGFNPTRHSAPFTAISHHARGRLYLIASQINDGWSYRVDYPYYSWAETVVRPRIRRRDFSALVERLNESERSERGSWRLDKSELASAFKFTGEAGTRAASSLAPEKVAEKILAALGEDESIAAVG